MTRLSILHEHIIVIIECALYIVHEPCYVNALSIVMGAAPFETTLQVNVLSLDRLIGCVTTQVSDVNAAGHFDVVD